MQTHHHGMQEGGYWFLATRQEELEQMSGRWRALKAAAGTIDLYVRGYDVSKHQQQQPKSGRFRTLVHGDAKCENLLFSRRVNRSAREGRLLDSLGLHPGGGPRWWRDG